MNRRSFIINGVAATTVFASTPSSISFAIALAPVLELINALLAGVQLANSTFDLGAKILGTIKLKNNTDEEQNGNTRIYIYNVLNPTQPEITRDLRATVAPGATETFNLPSVALTTPGRKVLQAMTRLNDVSMGFISVPFCCDSHGVRRCPSPDARSLGAECYCSGQGVGVTCK
ncbi:hypothetical protein M2323_001392 [Rhodoblastus acidophilus]|uniref:hypothetical protein n=1 Tax=Rhodoblastus acidophilus TaxID=1074 RepID=UPI0022248829|nr:hypothetical protein [Rhodoblastus acidophilus]MCW2283620.1 hypothetical protein [Rhodoblastus acidophilus]MCW2332480.1 hypothetical protein [Rhodoblastus acidophilus]